MRLRRYERQTKGNKKDGSTSKQRQQNSQSRKLVKSPRKRKQKKTHWTKEGQMANDKGERAKGKRQNGREKAG